MVDAIHLCSLIDVNKFSELPKRKKLSDFTGKDIYITSVKAYENSKFQKNGFKMFFKCDNEDYVVSTTSRIVVKELEALVLSLHGMTEFEKPVMCKVNQCHDGAITYYSLT